MALGQIISSVTRVYDKLVAIIVLIGLVGSLAYLAWHVGTVRSAQQVFIADLEDLTPDYPESQPVDLAPFEAALAAVRQPTQSVAVAEWEYSMWVPETRVACVDCRRPIPFEAKTCTFCEAKQPPDNNPDQDLDGDGIRDGWEDQYGLNPRDPSDAETDRDGDGFSNLEEFLADPQTSPIDENDSPSIVMKLCVQSLKADPFHLRFKSVMKLPPGPDGAPNRRFAINTRANSRTYFKKLGEEVEGFVLHDFELKSKRVERSGMPMDVDVSVLTLKRGDKLIRLTLGKQVEYNEYTCKLLFKVDNSVYTMKLEDEFDLQGKRYSLIGIDSRGQRVVIKRLFDAVDLHVRKCAESDETGRVPEPSSFPLDQGENP